MSSESAALAEIDAADSSRVGPSTRTTKTASGYTVVDGEPSTLAASAGLSLDVYALARMICSEYGSGSSAELLALAETTRNRARTAGVSIFSLLTRSSSSERAGKFGEQLGCWASTRLDPNGRHAAAARAALEEGTSLVGAGDDFFDPRAQNAGTQLGHALRQTAADYVSARAAEGRQWIGPIDGINAYKLMVFAPGYGSDADPTDALVVVNSGQSDALSLFGPTDALPVDADVSSVDATEESVTDQGDGSGTGLLLLVVLLLGAALMGASL